MSSSTDNGAKGVAGASTFGLRHAENEEKAVVVVFALGLGLKLSTS